MFTWAAFVAIHCLQGIGQMQTGEILQPITQRNYQVN